MGTELKYNDEKYVVLEHRQGRDKGFRFYSMVHENRTIEDFETCHPFGEEPIRAYKVIAFVNSGNDIYEVFVKEVIVIKTLEAFMLSVKRLDANPVHSWNDLQEIKNEIVGKEHTGFEIYPPESEKSDVVNMYHLIVFKKSEISIPMKLKHSFKIK